MALTSPALPVEVPTEVPKWAREPARRVGNIVLAVVAFVTTVLAVGNELVDFVPEHYKARVTATLAALGAFMLLLTKIGTELVRGKVYPPAAVEAETQRIFEEWSASQVIAQEGDNAPPAANLSGPAAYSFNRPPPSEAEELPETPSGGAIPRARSTDFPG